MHSSCSTTNPEGPWRTSIDLPRPPPAPRLATVLIVVLDASAGTVTMASAGHLPPVLASLQGARPLSVRVGPPISVPTERYDECATDLDVGETLLLYTDGLIERRHRDLDASIAELVAAVGDAPSRTPGTLCDHVLARLGASEDRADDIALLAVQARDRPSV